MKPTSLLRHFLLLAGSSMLVVYTASAQSTVTWDANDIGADQTDGAGDWLDTDHWWDGASNITWTSGDNAIFGNGGAGGAVTLASPTTAGSLTFNSFSGTYTLGTTGQALTINSGITMNADARNVVINSPITLGGSQTWTNNSSDNEANLDINAAIDLNGFDITFDGSATTLDRTNANFKISNGITGTGNLIKNGTGVLWFDANGSATIWSGTTTVNGGVLRTQYSSSNPDYLSALPSGLITLNGGVIETYWTDTFTRSLGDGTNANEIRLAGGASGFSAHANTLTVRLNNNATTAIQWGSTHFNPTALVLQSIYSNSSSTTKFENALDLNGAQRTIEVNQGAGFTNVKAEMTGIISDSGTGGGLTKTGDGTLILTADNTYNGDTKILGGAVQFGSGWSSTWTGKSLDADSNLELNNGVARAYYALTRSLGTGSGEIQITGGRAGFTNLQGDQKGGSFVTFTNLSNTVNWGDATFNPSTFVLNDVGAASIMRMQNPFNLGAANRTIEVAAEGNSGAGQYATMEGILSGTGGSLTKTGAGTLMLNGANTYDGGTTINGGGLWFNKTASMPSSGTVSVNTGAILSVSVGASGGWTTGTSGAGTIGGLLSGTGGQGSTVSFSGDVGLGLNFTGSETYPGNIGNVGTSLGIHVGNKDGGTFSGTTQDPFLTNGGTLTLSGTNTFTGGITINAGNTVVLASDHSGASGGVTLNHGYIESSQSNMIAGNVAFASTNNANPAIFATSGTLNRQINAAGGVVWTGNGGFAATDSALTVTLESGSTLTWNNANSGFNAKTLQLGSPTSTASVELTNNITINNNYTIRLFDNPDSNEDISILPGNIVRDGTSNRNLTVQGTGTLVLSGTNNFGTGTFQLDSGVVVRAVDGTGLPTGVKLYFNGGVLESSGNFTRNIDNSATNVYWNNNGGFAANGGSMTVNLEGGIKLDWGNNGTGFNGKTLILGSSTANNVMTLQNDIDLKGNRTITVNDNPDSTADYAVLSGVLANGDATARNLTKNGAGTLVLTNSNTYTGATAISAGMLAITGTGDINSTSAISVSAGASFVYNSSTALTVTPTLNSSPSNPASFSGSGNLGTVALTLDSLDDVLAPGNSPGIQTFGANQTWNSFTYQWEVKDWVDSVAGTDFDQIVINGTLDLTGFSYALDILSLTTGDASGDVHNFTETSKVWTILTTSGGITGFDALEWDISDQGFTNSFAGDWSLDQSGNDLVLSYTTVIPEPGTTLLAALGALALLRRKR